MIRTLALVAVVQAALVPIGIAPQLSARIAGDEYRLIARPVDPIDPFRGAYVDLDYPGPDGAHFDGSDAYVPLVEQEDGTHRMGQARATRPETGPYLACDTSFGSLRCGIESWFAPQEEALRLEEALADDGAIATITVDRRGNAALVALDPR